MQIKVFKTDSPYKKGRYVAEIITFNEYDPGINKIRIEDETLQKMVVKLQNAILNYFNGLSEEQY